MIPPLYPFSTLGFLSKINPKFHYFQSARASLWFLLKNLKADIVLIPSYTCPSVLEVLKHIQIEYNFVDLDENLDFKIEDLELLLNYYKGKNIVLLPTSLFNAGIRDYKKKYPKLTIIEDLTQSLPICKQSSDFAIYSLGRGKLISTFGGGILEGNIEEKYYANLAEHHSFLKEYFLSMGTQIVLKYGWKFIYKYYEKNRDKDYVFHAIEPKKIGDIKKRWISCSLEKLDLTYRKKISNLYIDLLDKSKQFNLDKDRAYLRMPVKKKILSPDISLMSDYKIVYEEAKQKRNKRLVVAEYLAKECSFLPTHNLVTEKDVKRLVKLVND